VLLRFGLVRDEDGRAPLDGPPAPVESDGLWASPIGAGRFRAANTPWFASNLATGDEVEAVEGWIVRRTSWSGRLTVRVSHPDPAAVLAAFTDLGVVGETSAAYRIAALDIPADADFGAIVTRLRATAWEYEEACVSTRWRATL
jgi:hypothetical protein